MPYIFKINKTGSNELENWDQVSKLNNSDIESIPSTVKIGQGGKVGSSIPSIFARIQVFDSAFKSVVTNKKLDADTTEHLLVSDCLDLLQFLYMYGNDPDITYELWNKDERLSFLAESNIEVHRGLGEVLSIFLNKSSLKEFNQFVFIRYKKKLIGGTSPYTLVYTSPNWKRKIAEHNLRNDNKFKTGTDDILFDDIPFSLNRRDEGFQVFLHRLARAYNQNISDGLFRYLSLASNNTQVTDLLHDRNVSDCTTAEMHSEYHSIQGATGPVFAGAVPLFQKKAGAKSIVSDFKLSPTRDFYKIETDYDGNERKVAAPLVLLQGYHNPNMDHRGGKWSPETIVPDLPRIPLHQRTLPEDQSTKYPYLTVGDFFCDTLMQLRFNINSKYFFVPTKDKFNFLLPINSKYFKFFDSKDLSSQLDYSTQGDNHIFRLTLPLEGGNTITIKKTYTPEDITDTDFLQGYNLGIFPSYKLLDAHNRYFIGLVENVREIEVKVYTSGATKIDDDSTMRTTTGEYQSRYMHIDTEVEAIEVLRRSDIGLIVPMLPEINSSSLAGNYQFAIDFGTTNTQISYTSDLPNQSISTFEIHTNDMQMVLLSEYSTGEEPILEGAGDIRESVLQFRNEFVPSLIEEDRTTRFPIRTVLYESINSGGTELFSDLNIGFNFYQSEEQSDNTYLSNLKWFLSRKATPEEKLKLQRYFEQLLWMVKNKCVLNNGNLSPTIIYMIPLSMRRNLQETIEDLWTNALQIVFGIGHKVRLECRTESEMPYYGLSKRLGHQSAINVDIGGGTTDILIAYAKSKTYISSSFHFAGNDIWGDGLSQEGQFDNGFIVDTLNKFSTNTIHSKTINLIRSDSKNLNSSDLSSLLFSYDDISNLSHHIKSNGNLKLILFVHLSAIIFKLSKLLDKNDLPNPHHLSFSGKGSEYISLITKDPKEILQALFKAFRPNQDSNSINVQLAESPKELTSIGALKSISQDNFQAKVQVEQYLIQEIEEKEQHAKEEFIQFLQLINSSEIVQLLVEYDEEMFLSEHFIAKINRLYEESFAAMEYSIKQSHNPAIPIKSSMFFWYLKHTLYELSKFDDEGI